MRGLINLALPALSLAAPQWGNGGHGGGGYGQQQAIYFLNNVDTGNSIVGVPIGQDGTMGKPVFTATGGKGSGPITTLSTPAGIFFSQSSVTSGGNYVFNANSASGTISMFEVNPYDPANLKLVGTPASTQGEFPMSVTYSEKLQKVCAMNAAGKGGVICFKVTPNGLEQAGPLRPLFPGFNESSPIPTGPSNSISQLIFNPESTVLLAIIKGNPTTTPLTPGTFVTYAVEENGHIAHHGTASQVADLILNFGTNFINNNDFLIAAPTHGGSICTINSDGTVTQTVEITVEGQEAICWGEFNIARDIGLLLDAGRTYVAVVNGAGQLQTPITAVIPGNNGTQGGLYDTVITNQDYSYSLSDPDGVVGLNLATGKTIGYLDLSPYGDREVFEGMALWPSGYGYGGGWGGQPQ